MSRTISLKNRVFASSASTVIPGTPVSGTPYRNPSITAEDVARGWPYSQVVDSARFNEIMYEITALLGEIERNGGIEYSERTDYSEGDVCRVDDSGMSTLYACLAPNGPSSAVIPPGTNELYWKALVLTNGGGGGGGSYDGARTIRTSYATTLSVGIGEAWVCTPTAGLKISAALQDMKAGYSDVYVTVPAGQTVTAGANAVFGGDKSITAGKVNHIKVEFQGLEGARMYVLDAWDASTPGPAPSLITMDPGLFYNGFVKGNSLYGFAADEEHPYTQIAGAGSGWANMAGWYPGQAPVAQTFILGSKDDQLCSWNGAQVSTVSGRKNWKGYASVSKESTRYGCLAVFGASSYGAYVFGTPVELAGSYTHPITSITGQGGLGCAVIDGHLCGISGMNVYEVDSSHRSDWTMVSGRPTYRTTGVGNEYIYGYAIRQGQLYRVKRNENAQWSLQQIGSASNWTMVSGYSDPAMMHKAYGILNGTVYVISDTTVVATNITGCTQVSGMIAGTAVGYAIDGSGKLWQVNDGFVSAVDSGNIGWTAIRGGYSSADRCYAVGTKDGVDYVITNLTATAIA